MKEVTNTKASNCYANYTITIVINITIVITNSTIIDIMLIIVMYLL